jgi:hypothetical protein
MNKIHKKAIFTGLLLIVVVSSCNLEFSQVGPETLTPPVTATETETPAPTITAAPSSSPTPEFAPFCQAADAASISPVPQCQLPSATQSSTFCSEKRPYNLILIDAGSTYEVLTKGFRCSDAGKKGDKQMITCTGQLAADFVVNVCNPACVVPTVQAAITECPQGYNYNAFQGCCTQEIQQINQNCMGYSFKTTTCVIGCSEFKREAKCKRNSWACVWNDKEKVCEVRK